MHLFSTRQILQFELRVEDNKISSTFYNKSNDAVLLATPNLWSNIQIVKTCILEHNVFNPMSLTIFVFQHRNMSAIVGLLERCTNTIFLRTLFTLVSF